MNGSQPRGLAKISREYLSHIPTPYGCLAVVALAFAAMAAIGFSSFAIVVAILR
jgi:hypothetical protein